jgi:hypothetical protein
MRHGRQRYTVNKTGSDRHAHQQKQLSRLFGVQTPRVEQCSIRPMRRFGYHITVCPKELFPSGALIMY